jgi:hypothetical protein
MKIFCTMIAGYADKRVGYNTLWEKEEWGRGRGILVTYDLTVKPAP